MKWILKKTDDVNWTRVPHDREAWRVPVDTVMIPGFIKCGENEDCATLTFARGALLNGDGFDDCIADECMNNYLIYIYICTLMFRKCVYLPPLVGSFLINFTLREDLSQ
jgi:hypothetical protein